MSSSLSSRLSSQHHVLHKCYFCCNNNMPMYLCVLSMACVAHSHICCNNSIVTHLRRIVHLQVLNKLIVTHFRSNSSHLFSLLPSSSHFLSFCMREHLHMPHKCDRTRKSEFKSLNWYYNQKWNRIFLSIDHLSNEKQEKNNMKSREKKFCTRIEFTPFEAFQLVSTEQPNIGKTVRRNNIANGTPAVTTPTSPLITITEKRKKSCVFTIHSTEKEFVFNFNFSVCLCVYGARFFGIDMSILTEDACCAWARGRKKEKYYPKSIKRTLYARKNKSRKMKT